MTVNLSKAQFLKLIEKIGHSSEASLFLQKFRSLPQMQFAVIHIDQEVLVLDSAMIGYDIAIMNQLGIYPIVVISSQPDSLIQEIKNNQGKAVLLSVSFDQSSDSLGGAFFVDPSQIQGAIDSSATPIVYVQSEFLNSRQVSDDLVYRLHPKKYILITLSGGIDNKQENRLPFLNLSSLKEIRQIKSDFKPLIDSIYPILYQESDCAVVITSGENLLKEIFTIKGSGTFIKCHTIRHTKSFHRIKKRKIQAVLEEAFGKTLKKDYFSESIASVFYQKEYEGVAIIKSIEDVPYLDKFAVNPLFQGTGLGKSLWEKLTHTYPSLIWRATPQNPFNSFYLKECQGCLKGVRWNIFWKNIPVEKVLVLLDKIVQKPTSFL